MTQENFPPHSVEDMVYSSRLDGYFLSHIMGLVSVPLLLFGTVVFAEQTRKRGQHSLVLASLVGVSVGLILYLVALVP